MTRTLPSKVVYWTLAALFGFGLALAVNGLFHDLYPTHWRYSLWWAGLLGTHLARLGIVVLMWGAFMVDLFEPLMLLLYGTQSGALVILGWPFVVLGCLIYLWRRGHYTRPPT